NIFAALVAAPDEALSWTRGKPSIWKISELVERGFCANCGTPLFFHHVENGRTNLMIVSNHANMFSVQVLASGEKACGSSSETIIR
ncbi:GFA family protein, partial [Rhizobium leguminosarum]|uniref:GFA family protein n=1 Tax=Rhizobium leguminosarum TaxID=384 RepID=UPI003F98B61A